MVRSRMDKALYWIVLLVFCFVNGLGPAVIPAAAQAGGEATLAQPGPGIQFTYDANGNVLTRTDAAGNVTHYEYDALNRLTAIRYPDNTAVTFRYNSLGLRTQMTDSLGTTDYEYDIHGRLTGVTDPNGYTLQYGYDPRGLLTQLVYPDGSVTRYTWDGSQRLTTVEDAAGATRYEYDAAGRVVGRTLPNGVTTRYQYEAANQLAVIEHRGPGGDLLLGFAYEFDATGNRTQVTRTEADGAPQVTRYAYDALYRLAQVTYPDGETVSYEYDAAGNRTAMTSSTAGVTRYTYNSLGQLVQLDRPEGQERFTYDANGNRVEKQAGNTVTRYSYDLESRLVAVDDGAKVVQYFYDGDGLLLRKSVNGVPSQYIHDLSGPASTLTAKVINGSQFVQFPLGYERLGEMGTPQGNRFYLTDASNSVIGLADESGQLITSYAYDPFGVPLTSSLSSGTGQLPGAGGVADTRIPKFILGKRTGSTLAGLQPPPPPPPNFQWNSFWVDAETRMLRLETDYRWTQISLERIRAHVYEAQTGITIEAARRYFTSQPREQLTLITGIWHNPNVARQQGLYDRYGTVINPYPGWRYGLIGRVIDVVLAEELYYTNRLQPSLTTRMFGPAVQAACVLYAVCQLAPYRNQWGGGHLRPSGGGEFGRFGDLIFGQTPEMVVNAGFSRYPGHLNLAGTDDPIPWLNRGLRGLESWPSLTGHFTNVPGPHDSANYNSILFGGSSSAPQAPFVSIGSNTWGGIDLAYWNNRQRYYPPPFPPGGGGGGGAAVGGISLDRTAEVLVNLGDIAGATFDPTTGQVVLIGREAGGDLALPPLNVDDLVVAIRTIYGGQEPSVSIENCNPGAEDGCMKVLYNGRFIDPNQPELGWLTYQNGQIVQTEPPATWSTHFGWVMFEADRYLKTASLGWDNESAGADLSPTTPFQTNVPDYRSEVERMAADPNYSVRSEDDCFIRTPADRQRPSDCSRMWFTPVTMTVRLAADGQTLTFDPVTILTEARFVRHEPSGQMVDVPGDDPATLAFVDHFNLHYLDFAQEKQELAELIQLAKIVGLVRWLYDNNVPVDLSWVARYQVPAVETPLTTSAIRAISGQAGLYGGVGFPRGHNYEPADPATTALAAAAVTNRPSRAEQTWQFEQNGETLTAVALNLAPAPIIGGYSTAVTDLRVPVGSQLEASLTRQYNSVDPAPGPLGRGWSLQLPTLTFRRVPNPEQANSYTPELVLTIGGHQTAFALKEGGLFLPREQGNGYLALGLTGEDPYTTIPLPDELQLAPALPGQPIPLRDAQTNPVSYTGFALQRQDGVVMAFDAFGRLTGMRDGSGRQVNYTYDGQQLKAVTDTNGTGIQLTYDGQGQLSQVTVTDGRSITYTYANGDLTRVEDSAGLTIQYTYDEAGRLIQASDGDGRVTLVNTYDELGRLTSSGAPGYAGQTQYNDQDNEVTYLDATGRAVAHQYDELNRLTSVTNALGDEVALQYDANGRLTSLTDANENTATYSYNERGLLTESRAPSGEVTRYLHHNESGQPEVVVDPAGAITFFDYDEYGRVVSVRSGYQLSGDVSTDGRENFNYLESDSVQTVSFEYDAAGNVTAVQDAAGYTTGYTYDSQGHLTSIQTPNGETISQSFDEQERLATVTDSSGYQVGLEYDPAGRLMRIQTPAGETQYTYAAGLLAAIKDPLNNTVRYEYDAAGRLVAVIEPNGVTTRYEYDAAGYLTGVVDPLGSQMEYSYDEAGRLVTVQQVAAGGLPPSTPGITPTPGDGDGDGDDGDGGGGDQEGTATPTPAPSVGSEPPKSSLWWLVPAIGLPGLLIVFLVLRRQKRRSLLEESQYDFNSPPAESPRPRRRRGSQETDEWTAGYDDPAVSPRRRRRRSEQDDPNGS